MCTLHMPLIPALPSPACLPALPCSGTVAAQRPVYAGASRMSTVPVSLGQPFNCTSPLPVRWLLPASWKVQVVGVDGAGNAAPPQEASWAVAFAAGQLYTRFTDGPYGLQPKGNMAFTFSAFDSAGAAAAAPNGFECWLESGAQKGWGWGVAGAEHGSVHEHAVGTGGARRFA